MEKNTEERKKNNLKILKKTYCSITFNDINFKSKKKNLLKLENIRDLIQYIIADGIAPSYLIFKHKSSLERVVCIMIPQFPPELLFPSSDIPPSESIYFPSPVKPNCAFFPILSNIFTYSFITSNGDKYSTKAALNSLLTIKLPKNQRINYNYSISDYLLTTEELEENNYPMNVLNDEWVCTVAPEEEKKEDADGYKLVKRKRDSENGKKCFAMDCEMVITKNGFEAARVTLIDFENKVLMDKFLKPESPVVDYNTKYSGITEEILQNVDTTLSDIQRELLFLIDGNSILVGHSLENDLICLKLVHTKIIDTAILFHSQSGPPIKPSLKWLAQKYLEKEIQGGSHDSIIDATITMELFKLKVKNGSSFGVNADYQPFSNYLSRLDVNSTFIASRDIMQYSNHSVIANNDEEVVNKFKKIENHSQFEFLRLNTFMSEFNENERFMKYKELNKNLEEIYNSIPPHSFIVLLSGNNITLKMRKMFDKKNEYTKLCQMESVASVHQEKPEKVFSVEDQLELDKAINKARYGICCIGIKNN